MVTRAFCPACGSLPVLQVVHTECLCECACGAVYVFAERVAPESEYPLNACYSAQDAITQWNACAAFYRDHHIAALAA